MKQLTNELVQQIAKHTHPKKTNIIRVESLNSPVIYQQVCMQLNENNGIDRLIAKITSEKYKEFCSENRTEWNYALRYLHQGTNTAYSEVRNDAYNSASYVDFNNAITKWRNESANLNGKETTLILLLGTEAATDDAGSLKDTSFVVSPKEIIAQLQKNYSKWFIQTLKRNDIYSTDMCTAIHTLYKTIFANINIDIFKLSAFIDSLEDLHFSTRQELINYICETLRDVWGIPSIYDSKAIPKVDVLKKGTMTGAKIITSAVKFMRRGDDFTSPSAINKLKKKFEVYAEENGIDKNAAFPEDHNIFFSYEAFEKCMFDFMAGKALDYNRSLLMQMDYAIIDAIVGTKTGSSSIKKSKINVSGEPIEAFSKIILSVCGQFYNQYTCYPKKISIHVDSIMLSDCADDMKDESFRHISNFMGGLLDFINEAGTQIDGTDVSIQYDENDHLDPFNFENIAIIHDRVKGTGKWGDPDKIQFTVKARNDEKGKHTTYDCRWNFSPYSAWLNAFSYLSNVYFFNTNYMLPTLSVCDNLQDFLNCESEDDFYSSLNKMKETVLCDEHFNEINKYFADKNAGGSFTYVRKKFKDFTEKMTRKGLFNALEELRSFVNSFSEMMNCIYDEYDSYSLIQRDKLPLLLNSYIIVSNRDILEKCAPREAILPAYHPVMLERIDAKMQFIRLGFIELLSGLSLEKHAVRLALSKLDDLIQLAGITQGTDIIYNKQNDYLTCRAMWEYFGVYYNDISNSDAMTRSTFATTMVVDDEDADAMLRTTPITNIIVHNVLDYLHTFPARADGLNIGFISPLDMQHIVAAMHKIAKRLEKDEVPTTINLKIFCLNSRKNSHTYLRKWLDSYFDEEQPVKINTYLKNISIASVNELSGIEKNLVNFDLVFNYNILQNTGVIFNPSDDQLYDKDQSKFPMTFTPDTIAGAHGESKRICISQFQFLAAKAHTQLSYLLGNPNSVRKKERVYRVYNVLEFGELQKKIIELSHNNSRWTVCIDPAIDRHMMNSGNSRIIGFTTGEGNYGELNVTVSAHKNILPDIKHMLNKRFTDKFKTWDSGRVAEATNYCVDELSQYIDGSRILKALNPADCEVHNFLAYLLTLQMLKLTKADSTKILRSLISLDSYRHWFDEDDELNLNSMRPDFMLLEIPRTEQNLSKDQPLHIDIKVIECKMGNRNDSHIAEAIRQVEKGIHTMRVNWSPDNTSIMHRYWLNQLYRAIIFTPLNLSDASPEYDIVREKIFGILNDKFTINWSGDVFAFWLDQNSDQYEEWNADSDMGSEIESLICHSGGQQFIQKMLLPEPKRTENFVYSENIQIDNDGEADVIEKELDEIQNEHDNIAPFNKRSTIPITPDVYIPYLKYLNNGLTHSRQESMEWFAAEFGISEDDRQIVYESNEHRKWETVLDSIISLFRRENLIQNSEHGIFSLTDFGCFVARNMEKVIQGKSFTAALEEIKSVYTAENKIILTLKGKDENAENQLRSETGGNEAKQYYIQTKDLEKTETDPMSEPHGLESVRLLLGQDLRTKEKYYWEFGNKELNNRHLLINGNSGCGKTYCIQTLLMEAAQQGVSSVIFDYTGGFMPSKLDPLFRDALSDKIKQRVVRQLKIPINPFVKHEIQLGDDLLIPETEVDVASKIAEIFTSVYSLGDQQKSAVYSAAVNGLKKHGDLMNFDYLVDELEDLSNHYAKSVISKIKPFTDMDPFTNTEEFDWSDIRDSDGTVYIMQLAGYTRDVQVILTDILLWDIWSFSVKNGDESKPLILVLDEAQNLDHGESSPSAKILTEGRKFGLSGWYATQFMKPQLSDDEIQRLQQAGQKLYFCPPDEGVMTVAKNIDISTQGAKVWSEKLKKLKKGECVTCGNMVRNNRWTKYEPKIIKVTSLQERLK